jgi:hypothetical protein
MKRISFLLSLLVVCLVITLQAQAPKPDPELKKLAPLAGHWTYEGEYRPGPLGPGGKVTGEYAGEMILGGFFFRGRWTEKGPAGQIQGLEVKWYDPENKHFASNAYQSDGSTFAGTFTVSGDTETWTGKIPVGAKQYPVRATSRLAADSMSLVQRGEISEDGNTWRVLWEEKFTKVKPAAKK